MPTSTGAGSRSGMTPVGLGVVSGCMCHEVPVEGQRRSGTAGAHRSCPPMAAPTAQAERALAAERERAERARLKEEERAEKARLKVRVVG